MDYGLWQQKPCLSPEHSLVLGLCSDIKYPNWVESIDKKHDGIIGRLLNKIPKPGDQIWQSDIQGSSLLLVQCGPQELYIPEQLHKRIEEITTALLKQGVTSALICLPQIPKEQASWQLEQMLLEFNSHTYQLLDFKQNPKRHALSKIEFYLPKAKEIDLLQAQAIASGVELTCNLANLPANICTPSYLANQALDLARQFEGMSCSVLSEGEIQELGMGLLLAVAQGSDEAPKFIDLQYKGAGDAQPIILVGKGITFDSGGLTIKQGNAMDEMKYDMCGAAAVLGTIKSCALLQLPVNLIGLIPSTENLLGGSAVKPADIVTSLSGQTVEIINTDAEGRLILADALTYAERYNPKWVIDLATLTGAIIVALGHVASGLMTENEELAKLLERAAQRSLDKIWRMPLEEAYQEALDSPIADMINGNFDRSAGSITAACFLSRFTKAYSWAHLDIAGTAWVSGKKRHATGRPVPLLIEFIRHAANSR